MNATLLTQTLTALDLRSDERKKSCRKFKKKN